ncbi:MAG TPA: hypothetical protein VK148_20480 [Xanthobacteraceae bacterium]|nr:hypothetical protein [Xanthobacteraceae bacterium]
MPVILFVLGILLTGVGIVLVGFAIPINESAIGQTLIIAGAVAVVGGPLLVGMGATISQLSQIAVGLKAKPASRTGRVAAAVQRAEEIFPDPQVLEARSPEARVAGPSRASDLRLPVPSMPEPSAIEATPAVAHESVGATAIERLRATMARPSHQVPAPSAADVEDMPLSPNGSQHPTAPVLDSMPPMEPSPAQRAPEPAGRATPTDGATKEPRLDFLFRSRPTRPASSDTFDAMWPKRNGRVVAEPSRVEKVESIEREDSGAVATITIEPPVEERRPPPMVEERRPTQRVSALPDRGPSQTEESRPMVAILKSGVVDGMAYTLYADGSIEAQLPQGTVRFGSIAELRAHIENNS